MRIGALRAVQQNRKSEDTKQNSRRFSEKINRALIHQVRKTFNAGIDSSGIDGDFVKKDQ